MVLIVLGMFQVLLAGNHERYEKTDWKAFSENLTNAIASDNEGLRQSAMQHIITYSSKLEMDGAVFDLVRIYRYEKDQRVRQMAVVALNKIGNSWAMNFLKRNLRFEDNPVIYRQIVDCTYNNQQKEVAEVESSPYLTAR